MGKYIIKRILIAIPVLIGITIIDYAIMCLAGSPLQMLQGPRVSQAAIQAKEIAGREKATLAEYHKFEKHLHAYKLFEEKPVQSITERDIIDYLR